jgi:biopolymer transport protein ExbB
MTSIVAGLMPALAALAQTPPSSGASTQAADAGRTLWHYIEGGGVIGFVTIGLSVVAVALAIVQLVRLRSQAMAPEHVVEGLRRLLAGNDAKGAVKFCESEENDSFLARVFGSALTRCSRSPFGFLELRSALEEAGGVEAARAGRPNDVIGLVGALAPMLGLLGTVVGMVGAFDTISTTEGSASPADLAGDISLALITTVQGLIVAIPCHAAHHYFRGRLERASGEVGNICEGLASELESSSGATRTAGRAGARSEARTG